MAGHESGAERAVGSVSSVFLRATDRQIGNAFTRAVGQAQEFAKTLDRGDPADSLVLAGFGVLVNLIAMQLEYTLDRAKRDPDALLEAFRVEIDGYKQQLGDTVVKQEQVDATLEQIGVDKAPERTPLLVTRLERMPLLIRLRHLGYDAQLGQDGALSIPNAQLPEAEKEQGYWVPEPGEVLRLGRELIRRAA